jgi:teichuronic acid biosynthesis glycosyltransferase TuaC
MKLLLVSNLFPDQAEPWRGLDNATVLHAIREVDPSVDIRVIAMRPVLGVPGRRLSLHARAQDEVFQPAYHASAYLPRAGGWNHRWFALSLARAERDLAAQGFRPDAILAPWLFPDACGVLLRRRAVPVVAVAQGSDVHRYLDMPMRRKAILSMTSSARKVVTRSEDLRRRLLHHKAEPDKVVTIYNGVDHHTFKPADRGAAREALQVPADEAVVLFVGNFLPVKGLDLLLESFAGFHRACGRPARLVLIGGGPLEPVLRQQATALGLDGIVIFAGRQPPDAVARWMQAADLVSLTSHNEGVPNVVLEACSSGRPIVCTQVGGIAEVLAPLECGRFVVAGRDPGAVTGAMLDAFRDPPDPQALYEQTRSRYAWSRCATEYLRLLR